MPDALMIRPATPYDAQAVARIRVQGWRFAYQGLISQDYLDSLSVAEDTERMRGYLSQFPQNSPLSRSEFVQGSGDGEKQSFMLAARGDAVLGHEYATYREGDNYAVEIAPCRTFVFLHELEKLRELNLIKGGDLANALVITPMDVSQDEIDRLAVLFGKPTVARSAHGILSSRPLLFENEPARHKLLDVLGDLARGPPPSVSSLGQLLWAVLDWLFDWLFWLPGCCPPPG